MAAKPKKAMKSSPARAPRVVSVFGEPVGRFEQVLAETRAAGMAIEPFEVTEDLVLYPPTPSRVKALDQYSAAHLMGQAAALNCVRDGGTTEELNAIYAQIEDAETAYNEALFGGADIYQQINEFFADRPDWERKAFENAVKNQFLRIPIDGCCQACGQVVDPKAPSGETESSGSSSTTGMSSSPTSPDTSTEPTPETGLGEPALGLSS